MNIVGQDLLHYYYKPNQKLESLSFDFQDYMFIYDEMEKAKNIKQQKIIGQVSFLTFLLHLLCC